MNDKTLNYWVTNRKKFTKYLLIVSAISCILHIVIVSNFIEFFPEADPSPFSLLMLLIIFGAYTFASNIFYRILVKLKSTLRIELALKYRHIISSLLFTLFALPPLSLPVIGAFIVITNLAKA